VGGGSGVLGRLTEAVDGLVAADHRAVPLADLVADIAGLHVQEQRLAAVRLAMVRVCDADGGHHLAGFATTGSMLTDGLRLAPGQGQSMLKTARLLDEVFPATAVALEQGLISYPHAVAITRAKAKLPADRLAEPAPNGPPRTRDHHSWPRQPRPPDRRTRPPTYQHRRLTAAGTNPHHKHPAGPSRSSAARDVVQTRAPRGVLLIAVHPHAFVQGGRAGGVGRVAVQRGPGPAGRCVACERVE